MTDNEIHLGIIMDGNGRWARRRGLPRTAGHREGARAVDAIVQTAAAPGSGIRWLTLYAFSSDNWARPQREVRGLMRLFGEYLQREVPRCVENGVRVVVIGRVDRLSPGLIRQIESAESATAGGEALTLRLAIDYSSRDLLVRTAELAVRQGIPDLDRTSFRRLLSEAEGRAVAGGRRDEVPDIDLLIRTGGDQRLSDFMLWECAYAELFFTPVLWPDFGPSALAAALADYDRRDRRFGRVLEEAV